MKFVSAPQFAESRRAKRRRIIGFMPGQLYLAISRERVVCRPLDVSVSGIAIFTEDELPPEEMFVLQIMEHQIMLKKVYVRENPGDAVGYRYGLRVIDSEVDLERLCEEAGVLAGPSMDL